MTLPRYCYGLLCPCADADDGADDGADAGTGVGTDVVTHAGPGLPGRPGRPWRRKRKITRGCSYSLEIKRVGIFLA